jgi:hypothetical protein
LYKVVVQLLRGGFNTYLIRTQPGNLVRALCIIYKDIEVEEKEKPKERQKKNKGS